MLTYTHPFTTFVVCLVLGIFISLWESIEKKSIQAGVRTMNSITLTSVFMVGLVHLLYMVTPQMWGH